ncbi:MAG: hypothetical protein A3I44_00390 [Candidatus Sungbacteria bacterium RIFCSPLOWO2_02_FULL_51_17]|uniref:SnoaL-like domain-containing protein n=1 Tax=Candidatus Sungbacteria bacterium RIFCSPHIGHO2_02_FULL_51_29 TaxID=1802273 RepID=A0A1G2KPE5_9BACT|nr:MAG: hypothetical protein A2676_04775 [Candidatus Sungbacteria bacterium RIFCSPHIGHO2_01_FULL_51_22]OHA01280.1 MAG: hypothetical protein A3C16_01925 [Candidatus Sungbacteria bacterium RIFCSPHIGHO2_02_FULL_51_29]OHA07782.1 MAG: hypothetical protein A3B29_00655 [Candidatus Sungbacteria bacterium RIFCSPLOWO2_01_FULL_51_34]OHA12553.1 MAG: hypothetical protein A3I44_00390 [Candidatus Sungbacteria bacterium RIFCSPLOWO2_02_FULL_51_17]
MTLLERKLKRLFMTIKEKPSSEPEKEVRAILLSFVCAINSRDIDLACSFFSHDAVVDALTRKTPVDVTTYREISRPIIKDLGYFFFDDVMFRCDAAQNFVVSGVATFSAKKVLTKTLCLEFAKTGLRWRIVKLSYI